MKRIIVLLLAISLFITIPVFAEDALKEGIFSYKVEGKSATLVGVDDKAGEVIVPEKLGGYTVEKIADGAFSASEKIEKVYIPDTVKSIGSMSFAYSTSIKSVRLSKKIKAIEEGTFYQCGALIGVTIPEGVEYIASKAFAQCPNLSSVGVPKSVTSIADDAFSGSDMVRIHCRLDESTPAYYWALARDIECEELIRVTVNGEEVVFDQLPITEPKKFRTLVPLRSVLEHMGAEIEWDSLIEYAGITIDGYRILIKPESEFMMVNQTRKDLTCPAMEYNGRVVFPIRDVVHAIGGRVGWDEAEKMVTITYEK